MAAVNLGTSVLASSDASTRDEIAGVAILAGQIVYRKASDGKVYLAVNTSQEAAACVGVALNSAPTVGMPVKVQYAGTITGTATLVVGEPYVVSVTAGSVEPTADIGAGDYTSFVGIALTTTSIKIQPLAGGVAHA